MDEIEEEYDEMESGSWGELDELEAESLKLKAARNKKVLRGGKIEKFQQDDI